MKQFLFLCALLFISRNVHASQLTFSWSEVAGAEGYNLYIALSSLTSYDKVVANGGATTTITYDDTGLGDWLFYRLTAFDAVEESDNSIELISKYCAGSPCKADFSASGGEGEILLTWESVPSIGAYLIRVENLTDSAKAYYDDIAASPYTITGIAAGDYSVAIFPKNAEGNTIEGKAAEASGNNVFNEQNVTVSSSNPPPSMPDIWIESFGNSGTASFMQKLIIAFDESELDPAVNSYRVDVYSSRLLAELGSSGDLINNEIITVGSNFCRVIDTTNDPMLYIRAVARDSSENPGDPVLSHKLIGNITDTYNEGISYDQAGFDSGDLNAFRAYYRKSTGEDVSSYCQMENLYEHLSTTYSSNPWKRADYDTDGVIGRPDYYFFARVKDNND